MIIADRCNLCGKPHPEGVETLWCSECFITRVASRSELAYVIERMEKRLATNPDDAEAEQLLSLARERVKAV